MKWAILIARFPPEKTGGNTIYVKRFSKYLSQRGHAVHIFTTTLDPCLPEYEEIGTVKIHRVLIASGNMGALRVWDVPKITDCFLKIDKQVNFDILNPHSPFLTGYGKIRDNIKIVHTLHAVVAAEYLYQLKKIVQLGLYSLNNLRELLIFPLKLPVSFIREWIAFKNADKIIVMSNYVKQMVLKRFHHIKNDKIFISRIGVDTESFRPAIDKNKVRENIGWDSGDIVFFTARRLTLRMGLHNLIKAFKGCLENNKDKSLHLFIAGKGSLKSYLNKTITRMNLSDSVHLMGFVADDELIKYYQAADAFVLPTEDLEGFGIVSIEALACNLPVIATPVAANPEGVKPFCPELLTKGVTPGDIAEKMNYFIKNLEKYKKKEYVAKIEQRFLWDNIIDEIEMEVNKTTM